MNRIAQILKNRNNILGRNERYLDYIRSNNSRLAIKIADDKILTKKVLKRNEIPVPEKIVVLRDIKQIEKFNFSSLPKSFVIKPVHGVRGSGIEIFYNQDKNRNWIKSNGSKWSLDDIKTLCRDIIDGKYSLFNEPDTVLIEERVKSHKVFKPYTYRGAPDVRIIVYNKIPIMSYVRIPTKESDGKANLDLGAIGAGIDIAVGKTTSAIIGKSKRIEYVPDSNLPLSGIKIPYWDKMLRYAVEASKVTGLGYAAVDFLIDREKGPLVVELNARPGLSIQIANDDGLKWRLKKASGLKIRSTERGIRIAKDLFGGEIEEEVEAITGRKIIGLKEEAIFFTKDGISNEKISVKVDTGADSTSIDRELAEKLGFGETLKFSDDLIQKCFGDGFTGDLKKRSNEFKLEEKLLSHKDIERASIVKSSNGISYRIVVKVKFQIEDIVVETNANISDRSLLQYKVIIGRKSLSKFLIDPLKK